jgi:hypothetical protein
MRALTVEINLSRFHTKVMCIDVNKRNKNRSAFSQEFNQMEALTVEINLSTFHAMVKVIDVHRCEQEK